jgi:CMP-N-acetylneuraminic acid synthetase
MPALGLITARGGSKSIPGKNIAPLAGRPLIAYTCEAARNCRHIDRVVLSTDDEEIAVVGREWGAETPFLRPAELSADHSKSIDAALHALDWLEVNEGRRYDTLVLLQPTSPLRTAAHLDEALELMSAREADTVVSVIAVPHRFSPYSIMKMEDGLVSHFWTDPLPFDRYRRQDHPHLYARNGPAVLAVKTEVMRERRDFYGPRVAAYVMKEEDSLDIDTPQDLVIAQAVMSMRRPA